MIPKVIPPLTGLSVLVTRPAPQCAMLCQQIEQHGGTALAFPAIRIEAVGAEILEARAPQTENPQTTTLETETAAAASVQASGTAPHGTYDLIVFLSVNAVAHGAHRVCKAPGCRIAAIGKATALSLARLDMPVDIVPNAGYTSEDLLAHPQLAMPPGSRILIVQGVGGRGVLHERFRAQGMAVDSMVVYRRERPDIDEHERERIDTYWANEGIDVVTLTSVETLENLLMLLSPRGREHLRRAVLLVVSRRIAEAAAQAGLHGPIIHAGSADDAAMIGALAQWRMRARIP